MRLWRELLMTCELSEVIRYRSAIRAKLCHYIPRVVGVAE